MTTEYPKPTHRYLRVYAFDPHAASTVDTVGHAHATIALPWEEPWEGKVEPGPINDYLEVIDIDPASGEFYHPIDLNHPHLLAQHGLTPSEGNPQFHQQMVFAVAMKVIRRFERALGRKVIWAPRWKDETYVPVEKLRIYPHALREANAYYSRSKRALLFGYFRSANDAAGASWIFTALSHDIIAHETTHAVLDGLHRRYAESTSLDSLAFHEAFADIVALFSHFTLTEAVLAHIQKEGGALDRDSLLSTLAAQFARGTTGHPSLRQYIAGENGQNLRQLGETSECHDRGAVLVAAVFEAFLTIYRARTDDLMRIAKVVRGHGVRLDPELAVRLTKEAAKTSDHVLRMCIRALDYMPPVDVRFGEFLRGIITADTDLVPDDSLNYRTAFTEAFRRRGILADDCLSMSPESLIWESPEQMFGHNPLKVTDIDEIGLDLTPHYQRRKLIESAEANRNLVWEWLVEPDSNRVRVDQAWETALGIYFTVRKGTPRSIHKNRWGYPRVEIHSVRTTRRTGPDGQDVRQLVIEVTQKRNGYFDEARQKQADNGQLEGDEDFIFRGGATLIIDLRDSNKLRYVMRKRIDDEQRLSEQKAFLAQPEGFGFTYVSREGARNEPFAMVHRGQ